MRTRCRSLLAVLVVAVGAAGCASSSNGALNRSLGVLRGSDAPPPTTAAATTTPPVACNDPTASFRPSGALPAANQIPAAYPTVQKIVQRGRLIAGVDQNTLLFGYRDPLTGELGGFDIDMVKAVARAIFGTDAGHVEYRTLTTSQRLDAAKSGAVDLVASQFTVTCARLKDVLFSSVYYLGQQEVLVRGDSAIRAVADLAGKTVCATRGSTSIDNIHRVVPTATLYPVDARTDCLVALQEGKVDAITSDDTILAGFQAQDVGDTRILPDHLEDEPYGIAVTQTNVDLVRYLNALLDQMRADGSLANIATTWLGDGATPAPAARYRD